MSLSEHSDSRDWASGSILNTESTHQALNNSQTLRPQISLLNEYFAFSIYLSQLSPIFSILSNYIDSIACRADRSLRIDDVLCIHSTRGSWIQLF